MNAPTFKTTTYLTRGKSEREIEVEATYTFDGDRDVQLIDARNVTDGGWIENIHELDSVDAACCADAPQAYAEWLAEAADLLGDLLADRKAA